MHSYTYHPPLPGAYRLCADSDDQRGAKRKSTPFPLGMRPCPHFTVWTRVGGCHSPVRAPRAYVDAFCIHRAPCRKYATAADIVPYSQR